MSKDPAFLFYTQDFMAGTMFMTDEQVGKYVRLLCAQHQHGHLSEKQMLHITKSFDEDIFGKFEKDENGKYFNKRLGIEIEKRENFSKKQTDKVNKRWKKDTDSIQNDIPNEYHGNTTVLPFLENENINENKNLIKEGGTGGVIVFYDLENVFTELINSQTWIESICRYVKNQTPETVNLKIREFVDMLKSKENTGKTLRQYKEYFSNWLKYDNEKSTGRKHEGDFRVSVGVQNFTETE